MFKDIFSFEFKYWFKRPAVYIYFFSFLALGFLVMAIAGGLFESGTATTDHGNKIINSPSFIYDLLSGISTMGLLIIPAIIGASVYKDYQYNMHTVLYAYPISKFNYMVGRFTSAFIIAMIVLAGIGIGILLACYMPWVKPGFVGPFSWVAYVKPYLFIIGPNILFYGALIFSVVVFSRSMTAGFIVALILFLTNGLAESLTQNLDNKYLAALIDPYGASAVHLQTQYWTVADENTRSIALIGALLWNRVIWTSLGLLIFGFTYFKFQFSQFATSVGYKKKAEIADDTYRVTDNPLPIVHPFFSFKENIRLLWSMFKMEFFTIIRGVPFISIAGVAIFFLLVTATQMGKMYDTPTYPLTYMVLTLGIGMFTTFIIILTILYSGILINRERKLNVSQLIDTTPIPNWLPLVSKFMAVVGMQIVLLALIIPCGIIIQACKGYYNFELGLYIKDLFGIHLIGLVIFAALATFVQVLSRNYFVGFAILLAYLILVPFLGQMGIEQDIFKYGKGTVVEYSDMSGYGNDLLPWFIYKVYWSIMAVVLLILSKVFWVRGMDTGIKRRWRMAGLAMNRNTTLSLLGALTLFVAMGGFIYYETNVLNVYKTAKQREMESVEFEKKYKRYEHIPQPRITDVKINADIFPGKEKLLVNGSYVLKNKTKFPIDSIHINYDPDLKEHEFKFDKNFKLVSDDEKTGYNIYALQTPLAPGDSIAFDFKLLVEAKGIVNRISSVNNNGSTFGNSLMPTIGYEAGAEITSTEVRKKYGLKPKERMADVNDSAARMNTYISSCADWINFETTVSTDADQIAIAPGHLEKEWTENGRKYFHYKMDTKILNFYVFVSARYEVRKDKWKDVDIAIYYNKGHEYNIDRMIKAVKEGLDYYTTNFGPYQFKQFRIIEFPRTYGSFAQSFANTIRFSESIGFISDVDTTDPKSIDMPLFVTCHELAHQWWAHQVVGADVKGATLMSESMAQYSSLMVMKKEYGKDNMRKFLKYELDLYLKSRGSEDKKEEPLYLNENQQYIHYYKGSVVMYALSDYIGEDTLNAALRRYIHKVAFQQPPYTNSIEFLSYIKAATPDSLKYIVKDMFETITIYDNKAVKASYTKTADGHYLVNLSVDAKKFRADSLGKETTTEDNRTVTISIGSGGGVSDDAHTKKLSSLPLNDWIDIGVFGNKKVNGKDQETVLYLQKRKITAEKMDFTITVDQEPTVAGIDPYNELIDKNSEDNRIMLTKAK